MRPSWGSLEALFGAVEPFEAPLMRSWALMGPFWGLRGGPSKGFQSSNELVRASVEALVAVVAALAVVVAVVGVAAVAAVAAVVAVAAAVAVAAVVALVAVVAAVPSLVPCETLGGP